MAQDIFLRAHIARPKRKRARSPKGSKWPTGVLVFDTETTVDTRQQLTLGAFRRCHLVGNHYVCMEEGIFYGDETNPHERAIVEDYVAHEDAQIGIKSFPPKLKLSVYSRALFVEKVFWKAIKRGDFIVAFNLPFDLSRLAVDWRTARDGGWSLILSHRQSRKTGTLEPNPERPRVRVTARNSKSAFIALTRTQHPDEWPEGRFLDLHTLAFALYDESYSLDRLCKDLHLQGKADHEPSGQISAEEIAYCREDVRATVDCLNALKQEFDRHPLDLYPDRAASAASIAKAYLDAMGVLPPAQKFDVPDDILGIAMEGYYGGRAECRIRRTEVPVVHTDFTSQYATVNALLGNWDVLTAANVAFEDATDDVRRLLATITLDDLFKPDTWRQLAFFALVRPNEDIFPVRTVYNGETRNIGLNYLTAAQAIWFAGPDCVNAILQTKGKVPHVVKAIRMVPRGRQTGLTSTSLRDMVTIDPRQHDFFRHVVEQRHVYKQSNESLAEFLKTVGNAGSYGSFVEVTPKPQRKPVPVRVFTGERSHDVSSRIVEDHGRWYFPPIAAFITAGGRLLLGMLERCVTDAGGTYLFCDTDSLCIVAAAREQLVPCDGGPFTGNGRPAVKALSLAQVRAIVDRFAALNPYDPTRVPGSILKIEDINFDDRGRPRQLFGFAVSAKRYVLYWRDGDDVTLADPKAHGLGYLYSPIERTDDDDPPWTWEAWDWMLRQELGLPAQTPAWVDLPAMMRVTLSTPLVLDRVNRQTRPFSFLFCVLVDPAGYPAGLDRDHCTLIAPFSKHREQWIQTRCTNVQNGREYRLALQQTARLDRVIPQAFGAVLRLYPLHPESKSLAPDGSPCSTHTRGLLQRASVVAGTHRYVGKETDRRWELGEDLSLVQFKVMEYQPTEKMVVADAKTRAQVAACGRRELMRRTAVSQHTLERICRGGRVRYKTLQRLVASLR
jgi:hypothetical protein